MCENERLNREQTLDALKFLSETHRRLHEQRRRPEIQVFFTTLTLFALIAPANLHKDVVLPTKHTGIFLVLLWVFIVLAASFSMVYLMGLHKANQVNKNFAQNAEDGIRQKLTEAGLAMLKRKRADRVQAITKLWQPIIIGLFAAAAGIAVTLALL